MTALVPRNLAVTQERLIKAIQHPIVGMQIRCELYGIFADTMPLEPELGLRLTDAILKFVADSNDITETEQKILDAMDQFYIYDSNRSDPWALRDALDQALGFQPEQIAEALNKRFAGIFAGNFPKTAIYFGDTPSVIPYLQRETGTEVQYTMVTTMPCVAVPENVRFIQVEDGEKLPFGDRAFAFGVVVDGFNLVQNPSALSLELARVTCNGFYGVNKVPQGIGQDQRIMDAERTLFFDWLFDRVLQQNPHSLLNGNYPAQGWDFEFDARSGKAAQYKVSSSMRMRYPEWLNLIKREVCMYRSAR